jgi:hypothetical protein
MQPGIQENHVAIDPVTVLSGGTPALNCHSVPCIAANRNPVPLRQIDRCRNTAYAEMTASTLIRGWSSCVPHELFAVSRKLDKVALNNNKRINNKRI